MNDDRQLSQRRDECDPICSRYQDELDRDEMPYCDLCEREGHTFSTCPERDDDPGFYA